MTEHCMTCGTRPGEDDKIKILSEVLGPEGLDAGSLRLCQTCLEKREARRWSRRDEQGKRLYRALRTKDHEQARRFTYLTDRDRIHLTRLEPRWVHRHDIRP
ncbi:MAG: hypothetical protein KY455_07570 [Euryarchaeota archaeon]|nr:hypothetical protein [Euryarchaeota archaeon]